MTKNAKMKVNAPPDHNVLPLKTALNIKHHLIKEEESTKSHISIIDSIKKNRINEIRSFCVALNSIILQESLKGENGKHIFSNLIDIAVNDYGVKQSDIASAVEADQSTVGRWISGSASPSAVARKPIIQAVSNLIEYRVAVDTAPA